jgi:glutamine amidotransferase-like uncharacterized protein
MPMYTDAMKRAFHSLAHYAPKGFYLQVIDNEHFISVKAQEKTFMLLTGEGKRQAVEYMIRVKKALEDNGAIVLLVREGGEE